jgi:hypothetical protein
VRLLQGWIDAGVLRPFPVELVARMLGGAFAEAGSAIASAADAEATRRDAESVVLGWLATFRNEGSRKPR